MKVVKMIILMVAVASFSLTAGADTWWVATDGCDLLPLCDGSEDNPFRTINFAFDRAADGDTIRVKPGDYVECVELFDWTDRKTVELVANDFDVNWLIQELTTSPAYTQEMMYR